MLNNYYICVATGCNRQQPEVLDIVHKDDILYFVTKYNNGIIPVEDEFWSEDVNLMDNARDLIVYKVTNLIHKFKFDCISECKTEKLIHCMLKGDKSISEILEEIHQYII